MSDTSIRQTPRHTWVPYVAAAGGAALTLKAVLIVASGDAVGDGPMAVLYLGGLLLGLAAAVGAGLRRERVAARVGIAAGCVVLLMAWIMVLSDAFKPVVGLVSDAEHVQVEAPVGLAGVVLLALAWRAWSCDTRLGAAEPAPITARSSA